MLSQAQREILFDVAVERLRRIPNAPRPDISFRLLHELEESAPAPKTHHEPDLILPAKQGWHVQYFYDAGELDYIEHFIDPSGIIFDPWELREDDPRRWVVLPIDDDGCAEIEARTKLCLGRLPPTPPA